MRCNWGADVRDDDGEADLAVPVHEERRRAAPIEITCLRVPGAVDLVAAREHSEDGRIPKGFWARRTRARKTDRCACRHRAEQ